MIALVLAAILAGFAFGLTDFAELGAEPGRFAQQLEYWFFDTRGSSAGLVGLVAGWMFWRRLPSLHSASSETKLGDGTRRALSFPIAAIAILIFVWARLNEANDLLFLTAAFLISALPVRMAGIRGLRIMLLPIVALLFALPIPYPLNNEIVWFLQNTSAAGTAAALSTFGVEIERSGAHLAQADLFFLVIEGCSGLRSILTLTLVAIVLRDLLDVRGWQGWLPVFFAPALALALNIVRIAAIVLGSSATDPDLNQEHLSQGLIVLAIGSVILFVVMHFIAGKPNGEPVRPTPPAAAFPLGELCGVLLVMSVLRLAIVPWPLPEFKNATVTASNSSHRSVEAKIQFPKKRKLWASEDVGLDFVFLGILPRGSMERRIYRRRRPIERLGDRPVDWMIAQSSRRDPRGSPISSKLHVPGRTWKIDSTERIKDYTLGRDIDVMRASNPTERALVYVWTLRDEGLWRESLRSLLALERGPFERARPRVMVQIATRLGKEEDGDVHARRILNRFLEDFRNSFRAL